MTLDEAIEKLQDVIVELPRAAVDAADQGLTLLQERAVELSSGPATPADLERAGRPYRKQRGKKRRRGGGAADPAVINIDSGDFVSAWGHRVDLTGEDVGGEVFNTDWKADLLAEGTETMVPRPLPEAVVKEMRAEVMAVVERRLEQALKG